VCLPLGPRSSSAFPNRRAVEDPNFGRLPRPLSGRIEVRHPAEEARVMTVQSCFIPSVPGLPAWSCFYPTVEQLITAVVAEWALGARDEELFVSCPEGLSLKQNEEVRNRGAQFHCGPQVIVQHFRKPLPSWDRLSQLPKPCHAGRCEVLSA
jgi:hypothetical protein